MRISPVSDAPILNDAPRSVEDVESVEDLEESVRLFAVEGWPIDESWVDLLDELDDIAEALIPWRQRLGVESITVEHRHTPLDPHLVDIRHANHNQKDHAGKGGSGAAVLDTYFAELALKAGGKKVSKKNVKKQLKKVAKQRNMRAGDVLSAKVTKKMALGLVAAGFRSLSLECVEVRADVPDEIELKWTMPKDADDMTEDDWDALTEQVVSDLESAVDLLLED